MTNKIFQANQQNR